MAQGHFWWGLHTNQDSCAIGTKVFDLVGISLTGCLKRLLINLVLPKQTKPGKTALEAKVSLLVNNSSARIPCGYPKGTSRTPLSILLLHINRFKSIIFNSMRPKNGCTVNTSEFHPASVNGSSILQKLQSDISPPTWRLRRLLLLLPIC